MPFSLDHQELLREIIVDNYQHPRNFGEVNDDSYVTIHMDSASCIDDIYIQVKMVSDKIEDVKWHGTGCAISMASTSIMSELILGAKKEDALNIMKEFNKMMAGEDFDEEVLGDAICFINVNRQPSRITCANISWRGLQKAFLEEEKKEHV
ncbi:MAG: SUF system NifU family Fe-S cluster assembly protein [Bacilli bacterium]|nr:SUF system NifU family Fe-S cluster assembly protein [Bacilli bacterium]